MRAEGCGSRCMKDAVLELNADYIIENHGTLEDLAAAVDDMLAALKSDGKKEGKNAK